MADTISIGELRQNPTRMLREVKAGAKYTITDHGDPVAQVVGLRRQSWVPSSELDALLREMGADDDWAAQIADHRVAEPLNDPWEPNQ